MSAVDPALQALLPQPGSPVLMPDRGGYTVTMRECDGAPEALALLRADTAGPPSSSRLHIGWGSFRNLDIIAARESAAGILFDVNHHQFRVWAAVARALAQARDSRAFVDALLPLLPHTPRLRQFSHSTRAWLLADLERPDSWLHAGSPERYAHLRALALAGRLVWFPLDMRGASRDGSDLFARFAHTLAGAANGPWRPDTLYLSNIVWMMAQREGFFGEAHAAHLAHPGASALQLTLGNLGRLFPHVGRVISAATLAADSRADDLRWHTRVSSGDEILRTGLPVSLD